MSSWRTQGFKTNACIYVGKHGRDQYFGTNAEHPKLTLTAALELAEARISADATHARVEVLDGEVYTENLVIPTGVRLIAPAATLVGTVMLGEDTVLHVDKHYPALSTTTTVAKLGASGHAFYRANVLDGRGLDGTLIDTGLIANATSGSVLHADVQLAYVANSGWGVADLATGFGHIHFRFGDLYLAGDDAIGLLMLTAGSSLIGCIDHILEAGSPSTTIGISIADVAGVVRLTAGEVTADTAYSVGAAGTLVINCLDINGTETGTATKTAAAA